jgi:sugar phosphate isomerase/epimerase
MSKHLIKPGLVSITFRDLTPREVIDTAARAKLEGIEWGGDVHAPHGDLRAAREVKRMTLDAGLSIAAYGSYYRVGHSETNGFAFQRALDSAAELAAPTIRVWAGKRPSADADATCRAAVVDDARRIAEMAAQRGMTVSFEYHANTLTDDNESARRLFREIDHPAIRSYWQPPNGKPAEYCLDGLRGVLPLLTNVHVFQWTHGRKDQTDLAAGENVWRHYMRELAGTGNEHFALLEFVRDNSLSQLARDARVLRTWLAS